MFSVYTLNSLSFSWIHFEFYFCEFTIFCANLLWQHHLREFTMNSSRIQLVFHEFVMNSLLISRISYKFTWCFGNKQWIYYIFTFFLTNWLSFSRIHFKFTFFLPNWLSIFRTYYEFTFFLTNSLSVSRILYLFRK